MKHDLMLWKWVLRTVTPLAGREPVLDDLPDLLPLGTPTVLLARPLPLHPTVIDLHGRTLTVAHRDVLHFLEGARRHGHRQVTVVTGKSGDIRREFPHWADTPPFASHVRSVRPCSPHQGGDGAFLVSLRKRP